MSKPVYLYITPFFPSPENWRGAYCLDFVKALMRQGTYDVHVYVPGDGDDYTIDGIRVVRFSEWRLPSAIFPFLFETYNQKRFIQTVKRSGVELRNVAVCHGNTASFVGYPLAVKKVNGSCLALLHHHDLQSFGLNNGILRHCWLYNLIQFLCLRKRHEAIDGHVFISSKARQSFLRVPDVSWTGYVDYQRQMRGLSFLRPVRIRHSLVLHNGVDRHLFSPAIERRRVEGVFTIGCVGNFDEIKDQLVLLKAFVVVGKRVRQHVSVRFVGSGECLDACKDFVLNNELSDAVEFMSEVRHEQLPDFYRSLDLFVLPSWFEGFGCVLTEAWSCGVPFITCSDQGADDIVAPTQRDMWFFKPHDADGLADKIVSFIKNRPRQLLSVSVDIDVLVSEFVKEIEDVRRGKGSWK